MFSLDPFYAWTLLVSIIMHAFQLSQEAEESMRRLNKAQEQQSNPHHIAAPEAHQNLWLYFISKH